MPNQFDSILMASPRYFDVQYAINPFMKNDQGELHKIDRDLAQAQWDDLKTVFESLGMTVLVLEGIQDLPDLVFTANQSFPFWNPKTQQYEILLSKMRSSERQGEVQHFEKLWKRLGYTTHLLESSLSFEGNGDAIYSPCHDIVFGGFGPRTDKEVYSELSHRFGLTIIRLELSTQDFYHLDTCFSILSKDVAAVQPDAFSKESFERLKAFFPKIIEIPYEENKNSFCGNCFCPDGKHVILQRGSNSFARKLEQEGFTPIEVDTSEFMKSGGSVFCLKLYFPKKVSFGA